MTEQAKQAIRDYQKKWRAQNKDKKREYNVRYWEKRAKRESWDQQVATKQE